MVFHNFYGDTTFTDVRFAFEDNKKIEAHDVMNNMCSNLFSIILKANPNSYPLIYLQGISMKDRTMIKKVKYKRKTTVFKGQLDIFIKLSTTFKTIFNNSHQHTTSKECTKDINRK